MLSSFIHVLAFCFIALLRASVEHSVDFLCLPFLYSCFSSVFISWDAPLLFTSLLYLADYCVFRDSVIRSSRALSGPLMFPLPVT